MQAPTAPTTIIKYNMELPLFFIIPQSTAQSSEVSKYAGCINRNFRTGPIFIGDQKYDPDNKIS